mmetsp:Transcript_5974/g.19493  ORF Transcript_5974/g.19493 Transcript_5974/m.19493 type:complete len:228 (-) Transcript_5974:2103-2786(-)
MHVGQRGRNLRQLNRGNAQRPNVTLHVVRVDTGTLVVNDLRGHPVRRANEGKSTLWLGREQGRHAKVSQLHRALRRSQQHIRRLHVTVCNALHVQMCKGTQQALHDPPRLVLRDASNHWHVARTLSLPHTGQQLRHIATGHHLHGNPNDALVVVVAVKRDNVRMLCLAHNLNFAQSPFQLACRHILHLDRLEGGPLARRPMLRVVHHAKGAPTQLSRDLVHVQRVNT